jgi:hypothetical protein
MLIGQDYEKVEFSLFGLDLVEPNAMIGDSILFISALILAFQVRKLGKSTPFFRHWYYFFLVFGFSFLFGGIGHTFFPYLDVPGKYPGWYLGIFASYHIEMAMISIYPKKERISLFKNLSRVKLILALIGATLVFAFVDLQEDPSIGLRIPSLNTTIGMLFSMGILGYYYMKKYTPGFRFHFISVFVLLPTAIFQTLKISFAPLFDRNDASHIFLLTSLFLYFLGVRAYSNFLLANNSKSI